MAQQVRIEGKADFSQPEKEFAKLNKRIEELEKLVEKLSKKKIGIETDPAEKALKELRAEVKRLDNRFINAQDRVKKYEQELSTAKRGTDEFRRAQRGLRTALKSVSDVGKQLEGVIKKLPPEFKKSARSLDEVRKRADQARSAFNKLGATKKNVSGLVSAIGQLRTGVGALVAALGIQQIIRFGRALIRIGADAIETKQKFDALIPGLTAFTGSLEVAEAVADRLAGTSERLKTPLADLIQPFLRITAATKETSLSLSEQSELFEAALITARAFGLGTEEVSRLITGFAQVAGKGTLQMEELRQQIGEVAFNALPALAKALGTTVPLLIEDVASGAIDAETALRGLAEGLTAANEAAGLAQLDTLKGDLGDFQRVVENSERALVDGLEPGLRLIIVAFTDFLEGNEEVIRELGKLASEGFTALVETFGDVRKGLIDLGQNLQQVAIRFEALGAIPGFDKISESLTGIGKALTGARAEAVKTFAEFEKASKKQATGAQETAIEIQEAFVKSFKEQAKAAGASADEIQAIQEDLKNRLGQIADSSADERRDIEKKFVAEFEEFGRIRAETAMELAERLLAIDDRNVAARAALLPVLLEVVSSSAEARVKVEAGASALIEERIKELIGVADSVAKQRILIERNVTDELVAINLATEEKKNDIIREFGIKAAKATAEERLKLEEDLVNDLVDLARKNAEDFEKAQERIVKAAKDAADKRIAEEKRVQKELEESNKKLLELADTISGADSEFLAEQADDAGDLADNLDEAAKSFGTLFGDTEIGTDPGAFLEEGFKDAESLLGGAADGLGSYTDALESASDDTEQLKDFTEELKDAISKVKEEISSFGEQTQENLGLLIDNFEALAEQGPISKDAFEDFGETLKEQLGNAGTAAEEAAGQVGKISDEAKGLDAVGTAAEKGADGIVKLGDEAVETGQKIVTLKDGTLAIVNAGGELGAAMEKSAEDVEKLGTAAEKTLEPIEKIGTAAEKLREPIIGEDEPEKLALLGTAAAEAQEPITLLAEPVEKIALSSDQLAISLPIITDSLVNLKPALEAIKTLLAEDPVDLDAIGTALTTIATPLDLIGVSLAKLKDSLIEIPDPLEQIREPARELIELVGEAAEAGSFAQLGVALEVIAKALPEIPEPLDKFREALKQITDLKDEIEGAFKAIAEGLSSVASEQILTALGTLGEKLQDVAKGLSDAGDKAGELETAAGELAPELDKTKTSTTELASAIQERLLPALEAAKTKSGEAKEAIGELEGVIDETKDALTELGSEADKTFQKIISGANAAKAAVSELRKEIAAAEMEGDAALAAP